MSQYYEIRIVGHLDAHWSGVFAGLELTHPAANETLIAARLPDQAALHGLLELIRDLNLTLVSVTSGDPSLPNSTKEVGT